VTTAEEIRALALVILEDWEQAELQVDQEFRVSSDPPSIWEAKAVVRRRTLALPDYWDTASLEYWQRRDPEFASKALRP
jgi:hypothetical protein